MRSDNLSEIFFGGIALVDFALGAPQSNRSITWGKCEDLDPEIDCPSCECGTLAVPLDYTNSSSTNIDLSLLRYPALEQPAKGSVLFNFGGPGYEARNSLAESATVLQK